MQLQDVYLDHSTYALPPARFEAGTPAIGEAIGLGAAVDFLQGLGMEHVHNFEAEMSRSASGANCSSGWMRPERN